MMNTNTTCINYNNILPDKLYVFNCGLPVQGKKYRDFRKTVWRMMKSCRFKKICWHIASFHTDFDESYTVDDVHGSKFFDTRIYHMLSFFSIIAGTIEKRNDLTVSGRFI